MWKSCEETTDNCSLFAHLWHSSNSLAHWAAPRGRHTRFRIKKQQRRGEINRKAFGCRGPRVQCGTLMWRWMLSVLLKRCYVVNFCLSTHILFWNNHFQTVICIIICCCCSRLCCVISVSYWSKSKINAMVGDKTFALLGLLVRISKSAQKHLSCCCPN